MTKPKLGRKSIEVACPTCRRAAGLPCVWFDGTEVGTHQARINLAARTTRGENAKKRATR